MTVAVLPAIWLVNRDEDAAPSRPKVAAVGLPAEDAASEPGVPGTGAPGATVVDPMGDADPQFLSEEPSSASPPARAEVVVGQSENTIVGTGTATYRSAGQPNACLFNGVAAGELITVVNVDNGRSVDCWTSPRMDDDTVEELILHTDAFVRIADLTDAPVHVEVRQGGQ